jgi:hypothetical protein
MDRLPINLATRSAMPAAADTIPENRGQHVGRMANPAYVDQVME